MSDSANLYKNVRASLAAFVHNSSPGMVASSTLTKAPRMFDFDAATTIEELPKEDLMGFGALTITDEGVIEGGCMLIASTFDDGATLRMIEIINHLYNLVRPGSIIPLVSASTGAPLGQLVVMGGATVNPVEKTTTRPLQAINIQFGSSKT